MKFCKFTWTALVLCASLIIHAQDAQKIKLLDNYEPKPFENGKTIISEITFTGLDKEYQPAWENLYENELMRSLRIDKATIGAGEMFDGPRVAKAARTIRAWLLSNGYHEAEINAWGERLSENKMRLTFEIKRGNLARISEIRFEGNEKFTEAELQTFLKSSMENSWHVWRERAYTYFTEQHLRNFYFSRGYLMAQVKNVVFRSRGEANEVLIRINEGNPYRIGELKIEGSRVFSRQKILEILGQKAGDIVDGQRLRTVLYKELAAFYKNQGYLLYDAELDPEFINPSQAGEDGIVNLKITIDEGRQFRIRRIEIVCPELLKIQKIRKTFGLIAGEIFNEAEFVKGIKRINDLNEFSLVDKDKDVELRVDEETGDLDLVIKINPK